MKRTLSKILCTMLVVVMLLGCMSDGIIKTKANAAYENTASSYNYPLRKIAETGRGFTSSHKGIDLAVAKGTAIYASKSGTVEIVYSGCKNYNGAGSSGKDCKAKGCTQSMVYMNGSGYNAGYYCNNGFGNGVVVKNDDGKYCYYAHMNTVSVKKGDKVTSSTKLGEVGSSGCSTGAHLHFAINSKATGGTSYNPFNYIFPGFKIVLTNNGSSSVNPKFTVYFPWEDFTITKCQISFGASSTSLTKTSSDSNVTTNCCFYDLGKKFGNLTKGQTYYIKVAVTKDGTTHTSSTYSFVAGAGDKTFLNYSSIASSTITVTFNGNGGTSSASSKTYTVGQTYGTSMPTATRDGYNFDGWYTAASGGTKITSSTSVTTGNKTFYAHWSCKHSLTEIRNAVTATCTSEGYSGDTYCKTCGSKMGTGSTVEKVEHNSNVSIAAIEATCQNTGLTEGKKCSVCGVVTVAQQTTAKKDHDSNVVISSVPATCQENGLTEGKKCSGCGTITVMQETTNKISCVDNNNDNKCDMCGRDLSTSDNSSTVACDCMCHEGGFVGFIYKIVSVFWEMFKTNKDCKCGVVHY